MIKKVVANLMSKLLITKF